LGDAADRDTVALRPRCVVAARGGVAVRDTAAPRDMTAPDCAVRAFVAAFVRAAIPVRDMTVPDCAVRAFVAAFVRGAADIVAPLRELIVRADDALADGAAVVRPAVVPDATVEFFCLVLVGIPFSVPAVRLRIMPRVAVPSSTAIAPVNAMQPRHTAKSR